MGKKTAKILIMIIVSICLLMILGDVYLPYMTDISGIDTNLLNSIKKQHTDETGADIEIGETVDFAEYIAVDEPAEEAAEEPFDPMSLIQSEFYIYKAQSKIDLYTEPEDRKAYKQLSANAQITYLQDMGNGYHKVVNSTGYVYYITDDDYKNNTELVSVSSFALTQTEKIPWDAQSFVVTYDGDRVLRLTKALYLDDNIAGVVPKGETVYKLKDYGQIFYVALEDGTAGYMNSQCLETTEQLEEPYTIVSAEDSTYAYDEMLEDIDLLLENYPEYLKLVEVGKSALGNDIPVLLMGDEDADYKILVQASIHAREYPTTAVLMKQLEVMLYHIKEPNSSGNTYDEILAEVAYYIIPMSNPDGVLLSQMGEISIADEDIRQQVLDIRLDNVSDTDSNDFKNYFKLWKSNINGVDLNRNFDANWELVDDEAGKPSSDGYKGSEVFSEVESQLIKKYVDMDDVKVTMSYHTSGNLVYWWYYQSGDFRNTCSDLAEAIAAKSYYDLMGKGESRYSHGGVKDYGVMLGKPGLTYEIGRYSSPIPPLSVYYAIRRVRVLPELGYWLLDEVQDEAEWLYTNMFIIE